ncbi:Aspartate/glutamate/uridylate kinase [Mrakia frigida]|uniref:Aspartate/glutamate/uridylate kinase n=1 Tax=Mrakia frigida TaxID=29902 RepID=UPI003FCC08CC
MAGRNPRHIGSSSSLTIVIKLGTSSIIDADTHKPLLSLLSSIVETICKLRALGHRVVLVSSGAIGVGMKRMGMRDRGKGLSAKQALAAIGQGRLIALWDNLFSQLEQPIAQILLTRGDIADRTRYLNAVNTFTELLSMGVVPIVNENDTVSVSEIKFGDNDTLSAIASNMVHADYLFLMTDVDCLYTDNPRKNPDAKPVRVVEDIEAMRRTVSTSTLGTSLGTGGMETKIIAAELATGAGVTTVILNSLNIASIFPIISAPVEGDVDENSLPEHTRFLCKENPLGDRKWWILHGLHAAGDVIIDEGAYQALTRRDSGGRLLAAGVVAVSGSFASQQAVRIIVRRRRRRASLPPLPYDLARSITETLFTHSNQNPSSLNSSGTSSPTTFALRDPYPNNHTLLHSSSTASSSYIESPLLSVTAPATPNLLPSLSLSSSIASLDPLSRSNPVSPAMAPITEGAGAGGTLDENGEGREGISWDWEEVEVGKGQANFNSSEMERVKGLKSSKIAEILGYSDSEYVVESITLRVVTASS